MLNDKLKEDLKNAMIAKNEAEVSALRMLISEIRYSGNGRDSEMSDEEVVKVIQKEIKKRRESAQSFRQGNRDDLAQKEESEAQIYQRYLPEQISDEELTMLLEQTINELGAKSISDMGKVMGQVMGKVGPKADSGRVANLVREKLEK